MERMPNPQAVPIVGRDGKLTEPWIRWLTDFIDEVTSTSTTVATPAPPAPTPAPVPAPDPGPATEDLLEGLDLRIAGMEQLPRPPSDRALRAALQGLQSDTSAARLAARLARVERAIQDILQGTSP